MKARNGDWLFAPFQCETCWFGNIFQRDPISHSEVDTRVVVLLRRANLDLFWSRESSTVAGNLGKVRKVMEMWQDRNHHGPLPAITPWANSDEMGMRTAITMLEQSLDKGRLAEYVQFESCRKIRSTMSNIYNASALGNKGRLTFKSTTGAVFHIQEDPLQSVFMERFVRGMKARMPVATARNLPLTGIVVKRILDKIEFEWALPTTSKSDKRKLTMVAAYVATTYSYSLRGNEGFWVDGDSLCQHIDLGREAVPIPHVVVALLGFFKAETGERMHVFSLANTTRTGIRVRVWLERVVRILVDEGKRGCPAFCDEEGYIMTHQQVEEIIHPIIELLQGSTGLDQALPIGVDVATFYRCDRSFRRGSATTALVHKVKRETIEFVNRWRSFERNKGKAPSLKMLWHYADGECTRPLQLDFTSSV